jgi:hypothetical protein
MGDSADHLEQAAPEAHECVCENEVFELVSGVAVHEGTPLQANPLVICFTNEGPSIFRMKA